MDENATKNRSVEDRFCAFDERRLRFFGCLCSCGALDASCGLFLLERWEFTAKLLAHLFEGLERARGDANLDAAKADALKIHFLLAFCGNVGVTARVDNFCALAGQLINA